MEDQKYKVVQDLQGGVFGMGRQYTIEEWRQQAIDWSRADGIADEDNIFFKLPSDKVIPYIAEVWQLDIQPADTCYYISGDSVLSMEDIDGELLLGMKRIGNYFKTREKAEQALEKLKAWQRLKDRGLMLNNWNFDFGLVLNLRAWLKGTDRLYHNKSEMSQVEKDFDLLFGGKNGD